MKEQTINCCRDCPFYDGSARDMPPECTLTKRGAYKNFVSRSHNVPEPIPHWCPIKDGFTLVKRDVHDKIISKTRLLITDNISPK